MIEEEKSFTSQSSPFSMVSPRQFIGGGLDDLQIILKGLVAELFSSPKRFNSKDFLPLKDSRHSYDLKSLEKWDLGTLITFLSVNTQPFLGNSLSLSPPEEMK